MPVVSVNPLNPVTSQAPQSVGAPNLVARAERLVEQHRALQSRLAVLQSLTETGTARALEAHKGLATFLESIVPAETIPPFSVDNPEPFIDFATQTLGQVATNVQYAVEQLEALFAQVPGHA